MRRVLCRALIAATLLACAPTTAPLPDPLELLVVVNSAERTLSLVPLRPEGFAVRLSIPGARATPQRVATRGGLGLVPLGAADGVAVYDIGRRMLLRTVSLAPGSRPFDGILIGDSVAYVSNPPLNTITRIDLRTDDTASVAVGQWPTAMVSARGRLFVLNANLAECTESLTGTCVLGESWITVVDPFANTRSSGRDSIPLPGPGNARSAAVAGDGFLYVLSTGAPTDSTTPDGRLSIIDPIRRVEVGSFGGFGPEPVWVASDGGERLFIASPTEGLLEFNTRTRTVVRGVGQGLPVSQNTAVLVDRLGFVYAIESGSCTGGTQAGRARIYRPNLTELRGVDLGACAVGGAVALVPADGEDLLPDLP